MRITSRHTSRREAIQAASHNVDSELRSLGRQWVVVVPERVYAVHWTDSEGKTTTTFQADNEEQAIRKFAHYAPGRQVSMVTDLGPVIAEGNEPILIEE